MKTSDLELLVTSLHQFGTLSQEVIMDIAAHLEVIRFRKNQMIQAEGEIARFIFFVTKGSARHYFARQDKEHTVWFSRRGDFMVNAGFFEQKPVNELIVALEPMEAYGLVYDVFERLCKQHHDLEHLVRLIITDNLFLLDEHLARFYLLSAAERYHQFLRQYPDLIKHIPLLHIASFLGMTPETLSRIRAKNTFS